MEKVISDIITAFENCKVSKFVYAALELLLSPAPIIIIYERLSNHFQEIMQMPRILKLDCEGVGGCIYSKGEVVG